MDGNTRIEILLSSAHFDRDAESLQHLADTKAENMQTDDSLPRTGADDLHLRGVLLLLLRGHDIVVHGRKPGVVYLDLVVAEALAGLGLGDADGADFGVGKDDGRDVLVGEFGGFELGGTEESTA